jgi:hypothetical protein
LVTPAEWRAARTDGLAEEEAVDSEAGREAFLRDLSVLMEGDVARRAARERFEGAGVFFVSMVFFKFEIKSGSIQTYFLRSRHGEK